MSEFDADRMPVYRLARELNRRCAQLAQVISRRRPDLAKQLERAASSVPVNITEGAGERARRDKARFYRYARRSATECAGILDAALDCGVAAEHQTAPLRELAGHVTAQLVLLARTMEGNRK